MLFVVAWRIHDLSTKEAHRRGDRGRESFHGVHETAHDSMSDLRMSGSENTWVQSHDMLQMQFAFLLFVLGECRLLFSLVLRVLRIVL